MADRAGANVDPWDDHCEVTTYVGGLDAMSAMRDSLKTARDEALAMPAGTPRAQLGHVYITGWRFNCLRDLSTANAWGANAWGPADLSGRHANEDSTALGLVLQLMQAGVTVRMLVWYPRAGTYIMLRPHIADHFYLAKVVQAENARLKGLRGWTDDIGVVALDVRTTDPVLTAAHHQKTMVIRGAQTNVAYVGGVDLAFTRRDDPVLQGDWESGDFIPDPALGWPRATVGVDYTSVDAVPPFADRQDGDLPSKVFGDGSVGFRQTWHDHHLQLKGPIVQTVEQQFVERWQDTTSKELIPITDPAADSMWSVGQVVFSSPNAFDSNGIKTLPNAAAESAVAGATTLVQMWRTIPLRKSRKDKPFARGEFTVQAGVSNAVKQSTQLIWMFDQYFWSRPLCRLLNARLKAVPSLHVIVILPPHADSENFLIAPAQHRARANALDDLTAGFTTTANEYDRIAVYDLWKTPPNRGVYVHAKSHTYDGDLLVCGSANLNRRSFTCDTEISCAVLDQSVVLDHQTRLWAYLFGGAARPNVDLNGAAPDRGKQLFDAFRQAVHIGPSILIPDPWQAVSPKLPNNVPRDQSTFWDPLDIMYPRFLDPTSVTPAVEDKVFDVAQAAWREPRLDEIVERLEEEHVGNFFPYRHS
jgi:phosphatidylserine/phosphatidylglycerophosphate/cardiolipin synthase-like enzyme